MCYHDLSRGRRSPAIWGQGPARLLTARRGHRPGRGQLRKLMGGPATLWEFYTVCWEAREWGEADVILHQKLQSVGRRPVGAPAGEQVAVDSERERGWKTGTCLHRVFQSELKGRANGWRCEWCKVHNIVTGDTGLSVRPDEVGSSALFWLRVRCPSHLCADIGDSCVKDGRTQEMTTSLILRLISRCSHNQLFRAVSLNMFDWKCILRILCN